MIGTSTDEYYQNVAIEALITILNDPACRLIVHQLAHLFRVNDFEDYAEAMNEVETKCNESAS